MNRIIELWLAGEAPAWDGLYRADGSARAVEIDSPRLSWFDLGAPLDVYALLTEDPGYVIEFDVCAEAELPDGSGYVCCGDGSLGSNGFFARLDTGKNLVWVVSLFDSNPFERVTVEGSMATFTNNLGNSVTVDLASPDFV
ncbi:hypothetical protein [Actinacidiphila oryziradicis]|jgi:hypothetical protein|uniref:hypothetical protein n=1 Tax=Actinacidiphila oryziradicis TaxID=2571141 RepID=UPI0023F11C86|nr:hypothetical protein [Actinacidiphila oryziradicis]MCW2873006.1 hypothetical protein [Actinacidiphila oryziradicis]